MTTVRFIFTALLGVFVLNEAAFADLRWTFPLNSGALATVHLHGTATDCPSANAQIIVTVGHKQVVADACIDDNTRPSRFFASYKLPSKDGALSTFYFYQGKEFRHTISVFLTNGTPNGEPLGNSVHGTCGSTTDAFISLPGSVLGDVPEYGYCLLPH